MGIKYQVEVGTDSDQIIQRLEDKIYEHNSFSTHIDNGRLFSRVVRGKEGEIIAGIAGWTWAAICEITQLWVDEAVRKNGIGEELLEAAELEARANGCGTILVRSYSFQAPHFYKKHGFQTEYIIKDFPKGYDYYILSKRIS